MVFIKHTTFFLLQANIGTEEGEATSSMLIYTMVVQHHPGSLGNFAVDLFTFLDGPEAEVVGWYFEDASGFLVHTSKDDPDGGD